MGGAMTRSRTRALAAVAAGVVALGSAGAEFPAERMSKTVEVGPGVFAFVSPETNGPIPSGNVVAIVGEDAVLVVDSGRFPTLARRIVAEIRQKTDKPVRYLVHTHWHLDHIVGDGVFREAFPGMTFVASNFTRRKMARKAGSLPEGHRQDRRGLHPVPRGARRQRKASRRNGDAGGGPQLPARPDRRHPAGGAASSPAPPSWCRA